MNWKINDIMSVSELEQAEPIHRERRMAIMSSARDIMNKYNLSQRNKIKDFLISEIDDENLNETIDFVNSDDKKKKEILRSKG
jgi:hypothetical protein